MSSPENPDQPKPSIMERFLHRGLLTKAGRLALIGVMAAPSVGLLVGDGETAPAMPTHDLRANAPAGVVLMQEVPGTVVTNENPQHPSNNEERRHAVQEAIAEATASHVEGVDPDQAGSVSDMFTQDKPYGVLGNNPGGNGAATSPTVPHTAYGPVDVNQLQLVVPAQAERGV